MAYLGLQMSGFLESALQRKLEHQRAATKFSVDDSSWERERFSATAMEKFSEGIFSFTLSEAASGGPQNILIQENFAELGYRVWDTSVCMAHYFECQAALLHGQRVLEIGAGTGLLSLVALYLGSRAVLCTDYGVR